MAFDFPTAPTVGQVYQGFSWDGEKWINAGVGAALGGGQCKLVWTSATVLTLKPFNGNSIRINGALYAIPAAGLSITNGGMTANTIYYIYAYLAGGVPTLIGSPAAHATSNVPGNIGTEILATDNAVSLVGMVYTNASSQFVDNVTNRLVRSWFNDNGVQLLVVGGALVGTFSVPVIELDTAMRCNALMWDNESYSGECVSQSFADVLGAIAYNYLLVIGGATGNAGIAYATAANAQSQGVAIASGIAHPDFFVPFSMGMASSGAPGTPKANYASRVVRVQTQR
jgi:hypothetical protein